MYMLGEKSFYLNFVNSIFGDYDVIKSIEILKMRDLIALKLSFRIRYRWCFYGV